MKSSRLTKSVFVLSVLFVPVLLFGQDAPSNSPESSGGTSNDLFVMFGSDLVRPGLLPKANYNIGLGHTFAFLKKTPSAMRSPFRIPMKTRALMGSSTPDTGPIRRPWD